MNARPFRNLLRNYDRDLLTQMWLAVMAISLLCATTARAQVSTAEILGTVTDASGAVVAGASVTAKNGATDQSRITQTGASGEYTFTLLPVGVYAVTVDAMGFKSFVSHITLAAGDRARLDATLTIGQATEVVEVQATTPALQTDSSSVGTLVSTTATENLPLNGRNIIQLVTLTLGINTSTPNSMSSGNRPDDRRMSSNYSANGQTDEINNNLIDGMDNNERFIGTIGVRPSIDAIREVRILTNLYTAEIGRTAGGVVDLITKSGGNAFHGSAFEFFRNDKFDANTWVPTPKLGRPKAELRQNQFGGSIGGPIKKNQTFFFADYEGFRQRKGVTSVSTVPTAYEETHPGDLSDLCNTTGTPGTACNGGPILAGTLNPIGLAYLALYPTPNTAAAYPGIVAGKAVAPSSNFTYTTAKSQDTGTFDVRIDQQFNQSNTLFGRYSYNNVTTLTPSNFPNVNGINPGTGPFGSFPGTAKERQQSIGTDYVHVFRPDLLLQLRAGYLRSNIASLALNTGTKDAATKLGFPCTPTSCVNVGALTQGIPSLDFNGGYSSLGDDAFVPLTTIDNTSQYSGALTCTHGKHSFKFGSMVIRRQLSPTQSSYYRGDMRFGGSGLFSTNAMADMLLGEASTVQRGNTLIAVQLRAWEPSTYAQDDWRATRWLTLNLGIRYDVFTPYVAHNGAFSNFDPKLGLLIGPTLAGAQASDSTAGVRTDYSDFAPRLGFAATLGHGLVARGGFGVSYFPGSYASGSVMRNAPFNFNFTCGSPGFNNIGCTTVLGGTFATPTNNGFNLSAGIPVPTFNLALATNPANYNAIRSTPFDQKASYLKQFSLQVQKEFAGNVAAVGYVGNLGGRLTVQPNINQQAFAGGPYPFPLLPAGVNITPQLNQGISRYSALQSSFERRISHGLAANIGYTWSHNLTNAPIIDEGPGQFGNCVGQCRVDTGAGTGAFNVVNSWQVYDYGNADVDIRHRFTALVTYELPFGKSMTGAPAQIVKGWTINGVYSWASGFPFTVQNASSTISGLPVGNDRPNQNGNPNLSNPTNAMWFNTAAFTDQAAGTLGDERRNQLYGPPQRAMSFSTLKNFPLREFLKMQFRWEVFNLFNTPSFANPGNTRGSGNFGKVTATTQGADQREMQFALKFLF